MFLLKFIILDQYDHSVLGNNCTMLPQHSDEEETNFANRMLSS